MKDSKKTLLFCHNCKKVSNDLNNLYFVDDLFLRPFCSDDCIVEFFIPYIEGLEEEEKEVREEMEIHDIKLINFIKENDFLSATLDNPSEVWKTVNEIGETFYTFISTQDEIEASDNKKWYYIVRCFMFEQRPSLVLFESATTDEKLVEHYRGDESVNIEASREDGKPALSEQISADLEEHGIGEEVVVDQEIMEGIEQKKSSFLANLLSCRKDQDIHLEKFHLYEEFVPVTLKEPDEIYKYEDDDGEFVFTYIKSFNQGTISFFYFVICMNIPTEDENEEFAIVPILTFPSIDGELYSRYKKGEQLSGYLKN